mmetsp:Transcript_20243/g.56162  ORF Transcript_20243/g.56162 Transcript_20243/m.56162 type:complete len:676 (+) Transcript_20243:135-2162(+)
MPEPRAAVGDGMDSLFAPAVRRNATGPREGTKTVAAAPPPAPSASAEALSKRYRDEHILHATDRIVDGFRDYFAEGVIVDRSRDERLEDYVHKARKKLQKASDPVTAVMVMALLTSELCGRSGHHASGLKERFKQRIGGDKGGVMLGSLLADDRAKAKKKDLLPGAALARHRALAFKYLADYLGGPDCTLERDSTRNVAWNSVRLDQVGYVVDVVHDPGALYEAGSPKQQEYFRLLEPDVSVKMLTTISAREELTGRVPRPAWHVEASELQCGRGERDKLGKGGFGEVFRGSWAGTIVAIKVVKDTDPSDYDVMDFVLEIALLSRLNHPNVMRFWRGCVEFNSGKRGLLMVTEHIARGGLSGLLHGHGGQALPGTLTIAQSLWLSLGVARGMQYLHTCKVLHLDLKSPNVLVDNDWTPKLCDFGLAKISAKDTGEGLQTTLRGVSPVWAPPEMFDEQADDMTEKADVYSYGIVFFEIMSRKLPFQEISQRQLPKAKFEGVLPHISKPITEDCGALILSCCSHRPSARPSMRGVAARILELAEVRCIDLARVAMPPWETSAAGAGGREEAGASRESEARMTELEEEKRIIQKRIEDARGQRSRIQESHFGKGLAKEEIEPMFPPNQASGGGAAAGSGPGEAVGAAGGGAASGGARPTLVSATPTDRSDSNKCCTLF